MATYLRRAHLGAALLFVVGVPVQGFLAGAALTQLGGSGDFGPHIMFGEWGMGVLDLAVLATALVSRVPRGQIGLVIGLTILYVIQASLPRAAASAPLLAALHPANAMVLLLVASRVAWQARRLAATEPGAHRAERLAAGADIRVRRKIGTEA